MKPYVIKQGDYLLKVAHILGFEADKVWNDPKNAELKKARKDPGMLKPGDILFIPDEPKKGLKLNLKEANTFVARVPVIKVSVVISEDDEPLANEKYVVEGLGDETELTTDADGRVSFDAPVHAREATLRFIDRDTRLRIAIGDLDPADTPSGARMRLTSLGYYGGRLTGADPYVPHDEDELAGAVRAFQKEHGIEPTGSLDDATRDALVEAHGS